ncbi:SDR family oxidoreductase [Streptomyces sp. NPDC004959]|uniref:SDR family oxidoreductase n=1 Tax=unclassified Streptomyces TaxID=2593676 RepID=UPI0004C9F53F|nr:SDR family oxidoreductase [Streptomyces sp. NRRL F-5630]
MDLGLKDRVFAVTGATRGLGYATAEALVAEGAKVVVTGRKQESADAAAARLGAGAVGVGGDNADPVLPGRLVATARERFGRFDGVLVSVGGPPPGFFGDLDDEGWRASFESVFLGAVRLARTAAAELGEGGAIGFVLSSSVHEPIPGLTLSNGLRPALAGVAKSLASELGPRGIRVFGVLPGKIDTARIRELHGGPADPSGIPLGRLGTPEEFGRTTAFLLSPAASYVTGVMLPVDGGARHGF